MSMLSGYDNQTVQWCKYLGVDAYGQPKYGEPVAIPCRLQHDRNMVRDEKGEITVSEAVVYTTAEIDARDALAVGGESTRIIRVSRKVDLDGQYDHTEVRI